MNTRLELANIWLSNKLRLPISMVKPLAGDASFRHYYRVTLPDTTYILMDAPPDKEDCHPYLRIAAALSQAKVPVPAIIAQDLTQGFLLLQDFGDHLLLPALDTDHVDMWYRQALKQLIDMQKIKPVKEYQLPQFDQAMMWREMQLCREWFIEGYLEYHLQAHEKMLLEQTFNLITQKIEPLPYTFVHRDYHARNLMILPSGELGVLDFQDAVWGPITYDAVSLLKDCYIAWPRDKVLGWLGHYHYLLTANNMMPVNSFEHFVEIFDWVGIQRHLKVLGIFSRLYLRDHKAAYLKDIPLTLQYLTDTLERFEILAEFSAWMHKCILPTYKTMPINA